MSYNTEPSTPPATGFDAGDTNIESKEAVSVEAKATTTPDSDSDADYEAYRSGVLAGFTAEDDRRLMRKVDWHFLPLMAVMYIVKQIDYINASTVKVLQVGEPTNIMNELHLTADNYNWLQTLYFLGMVLFEVPSNLVLRKVTPRKWMTRIFFSWGIVVACHAAVHNKAGIYTCRFLLGVLEAGFFPGLTTQMCSWYRSDEYGRPIMVMFVAQSVSSIIGSLLVYGISYMDGIRGLSAWQWVFLLEGIVTILFSGVIYWLLPDWPRSERSKSWLTPAEQEYLEVRLSENAPRTKDASFRPIEIWETLQDPRVVAFTSCQFLLNVAGYGLSWQLPTIITSLGFAKLPANQLLNIPPAVAMIIGQLTVAWIMRRAWFVRPYLNVVVCGGMLVFYIVLCFPVNKAAVYASCVLGQGLYYTYFVSFWAWRSASLQGATGTAFALAAQTAIAQIGATVAPSVFPGRWAYNGYKKSFYICTACVGVAFITTLVTWYLTRSLEREVLQVRQERIRSEKHNKVFDGDDVHVFRNRITYTHGAHADAR